MQHEQERAPLAAIVAVLTSPQMALTGAALIWAGNFIVGRALRGDVPPVSLNFWRWVTALVLLLPLSYVQLRQSRALLFAHWKIIAALGLTGVAMFNTCVYFALTTTTAINALLFLSTTPVVIVLGSWLFFRDTVTYPQMAGIGVSLLGALTVIARGDLDTLLHLQLNQGDLWMLLAVLVWSIYSVLLKRRPKELPPYALLTGSVVTGLLCMLPVYLWRVSSGETLSVNLPNILAVLYIGILASVVSFLFWNRGVAQIGPNRAGMFLHLMPVFGALLSVVLLGEGMALFHVVGAVLVFSGIALMNWQPKHA